MFAAIQKGHKLKKVKTKDSSLPRVGGGGGRGGRGGGRGGGPPPGSMMAMILAKQKAMKGGRR